MSEDRGAGGRSVAPGSGSFSRPEKKFGFVMITQRDPLYLAEFFREFLARYRPLDELKCVIIAPAMGKRSFLALVRQMYRFYGPVDFTRMGVRYVRHRILAAGAAAGMGQDSSPAGLCRASGVAVRDVADVNAPETLEFLAEVAPDLIVSVAAPQVFRRPLLALARRGSLNIHNSALPRYRGMMPNFWQMLHGERDSGTTVHYINEGIDDGDIVLQRMTPIRPGESLDSLVKRTKRLGAQLMIEAIGLVKSGAVVSRPNPHAESSYFSFPSREDVRRFRRKGLRLL